MRIGIIVAMDKELQQLKQVFKDCDVIVEKCGIGKVNAALGAQRMINTYKPDCIISSGCAGGNGDDIKVQDIIVSAELCYHDVYCGKAIDDTTVYGQVQGLPARWMMVGAAMAVQENGTNVFDYFAMLRGWEMARDEK